MTLTTCGVCGEPASFVITVEMTDGTDRYGGCVEHALDMGNGIIEGVRVEPIQASVR